MNAALLRQRLKPWMLPIAMVSGLLFHQWIHFVTFLTPYLIFAMLLVTFCRINPSEFRITGLSWKLLCVQIGGSIALFYAFRGLNVDVAQSLFICVFCPTATAAPVITGMLGGSVPRLVTYSLLSNVTAALTAPLLFSFISDHNMTILDSTASISVAVIPMILAPLFTAFALRRWWPKAHSTLSGKQSVGFYIWAVSLLIVVGKSVSFVLDEPASKAGEIVIIALGAGVVCLAQFWIGRRIGARHGDRIAGAQGLAQKNTVLAIWMALTYLNPIASVGPAAYIAWQNTINSLQLYFKQRKDATAMKQKAPADVDTIHID